MKAPRFDRVRPRMADLDVDALLLSVGADLPWQTGHEAVPLERLTELVGGRTQLAISDLVVTEAGPERLDEAPRELAVVG